MSDVLTDFSEWTVGTSNTPKPTSSHDPFDDTMHMRAHPAIQDTHLGVHNGDTSGGKFSYSEEAVDFPPIRCTFPNCSSELSRDFEVLKTHISTRHTPGQSHDGTFCCPWTDASCSQSEDSNALGNTIYESSGSSHTVRQCTAQFTDEDPLVRHIINTHVNTGSCPCPVYARNDSSRNYESDYSEIRRAAAEVVGTHSHEREDTVVKQRQEEGENSSDLPDYTDSEE